MLTTRVIAAHAVVLLLVINSSCLALQTTVSQSTVAPFATDSPTGEPAPAIVVAARGSPSTPAPPSSMCESFKTPLPTPTPGENLPVPANSQALASFPPQTGAGQLLQVSFYGDSIGRTMPLVVYLPPGYGDSDRRYPVLYLLSGFAGDALEWVDYGVCDALEELIRGGYMQPVIVIMPSGDHSWWFNHAAAPGSDGKKWGDYVWKDVVDYADANYRTLPRRESRAIGGLSAGAQGALMLALTHRERFSIAGAHSPSMRHADGSLAFFGDQQYFNQYDPEWLFRNATTWKGLDIWIDVAAGDDQWGDSVHELHDLLTSLGVPHTFQDTWHGIHDGYYWSAHVGDYMMWYASHLVGQPPG